MDSNGSGAGGPSGDAKPPGEELLPEDFDEAAVEPDPLDSLREENRKYLAGLAGWDEFYAAARKKPVPFDMYHSLVIDRVAREMGCDEARAEQLRALVTEEQDALTEAMLERFGTKENIRAAFVRGTNAEQLGRLVAEVRAEFDESWRDHFSGAELEVIGHHFRGAFSCSSGSIWPLGVRVGGPFSPPSAPPTDPEQSEP